MIFFLGITVAMFYGRKIGWLLSRVLYRISSISMCMASCLIWGCVVAVGLRLLMNACQPGLLLKTYGFGAAAYASVPNYGLVDESTIPASEIGRHALISSAPLLTFIVGSAYLAFS